MFCFICSKVENIKMLQMSQLLTLLSTVFMFVVFMMFLNLNTIHPQHPQHQIGTVNRHRVTHKECDFTDDLKRLKSNDYLINQFVDLKGVITNIHGGVVLKQINHPISMLPLLIRSVDRIMNDH